jgi:hypothetical protein
MKVKSFTPKLATNIVKEKKEINWITGSNHDLHCLAKSFVIMMDIIKDTAHFTQWLKTFLKEIITATVDEAKMVVNIAALIDQMHVKGINPDFSI